jgi:AraC-like DNA-binding protein
MKLKVFLFLLMVSLVFKARAYRIITPEPFNIARKNYLKLQLLAEKGDAAPDSVFFDILYNSGLTIKTKTNASLSMVITLNEFNDGVFYVQARVYHQNKCDTLGSKYDPAGIPVILDRRIAFNETIFQSNHLEKRNDLQDDRLPYVFNCNNNKLSFSSFWDEDSLYLHFIIKDANLNYVKPGYIDLFQAKNYLNTLWNSDCIEIGFDMQHDRSEWKGINDYELLVDVKGNYAGNRWDAEKNFFTHWGENTRISVEKQGTLNNNEDMDEGYTISIAVPWTDLGYVPKADGSIGFDIQLYDKDALLDDAFRTSISGTNPESNDNTSEWTSLVFIKGSTGLIYYLLAGGLVLVTGYFIFKKGKVVPKATGIPLHSPDLPYSDSIQKAISFIAVHYQHQDLSRQQIAEHVFLSEKYVSSLFMRETGKHLVAYINNYRIEKAIQLLKETRLSVSEIAFKVGYGSLQNFNKNFKAITQKSPSEFRG